MVIKNAARIKEENYELIILLLLTIRYEDYDDH